MICSGACPREVVCQHPASPGPILDFEDVCRAAFDRQDRPRGNIHQSFVPQGQLAKGVVSVWRTPAISEEEIAKLISLVPVPEGQRLYALCFLRAAVIRRIAPDEIGGHRFCIVDEAQTDTLGNNHPRHAHIRLCDQSTLSDDLEHDLDFQQALLWLRTAFQKGASSTLPLRPG